MYMNMYTHMFIIFLLNIVFKANGS